MSTHQKRQWISISYPSIVVAALLVATQLAVLTAFQHIDIPRQSGATSPVHGGLLAGILVLESVIIVLVWRFYNRLPDWIHRLVKATKQLAVYSVAAIAGIGYGIALDTPLWPVTASIAVLFAFGWYADTDGLEWIPHNMTAFVLGVLAVTAFGYHASPPAVIVFLLLTLVWDYTAVSLSDFMDDLIGFSTSAGIPNYFVIPARLRIDNEQFEEWMEAGDERGESPDSVETVIGLGDIVLPSLLVVTSALTHGFTAIQTLGAVTGSLFSVGFLHAALESSESGLPALVWLNPGVIAGYGFGAILVVIL